MKKNRSAEPEITGSYYVFIESVAKNEIDGNNPFVRTQYMLDAIDVTYWNSADLSQESYEGLSIMRLQTTTTRLGKAFDLPTDDIEGNWALIQLGFESGKPHVWKLNATDSYSGKIERFNLISFHLIDAVNSLAKNLTTFCTVKAKSISASSTDSITPDVGAPSFGVRVVDVGHASCVAIHEVKHINSRILGYYDVGAPVFFHLKAFPRRFKDISTVPEKGFVVLSHWDFDHYALAVTIMPSLQKLKWFAPDQPVGPNASKLQKLLGANLSFVRSTIYGIQTGINMCKGTGPLNDRNNSGYALRIGSGGNAVLLTGDVGYDYLLTPVKANIRGLGITHHGGNGSKNPPRPMLPNGCVAAVSYGLGNRYNHPNPQRLNDHHVLGWHVEGTAGPVRGDRWL